MQEKQSEQRREDYERVLKQGRWADHRAGRSGVGQQVQLLHSRAQVLHR